MEELTTGPYSMAAETLPDFKILPYPSGQLEADVHEDQTLFPTSNNPITLNASSSWTYCGPLLTLEETSLPSSFHTWAQATVNGSLLTSLFSFLAYVHEFLASNNLAHYWLTVRATKGSTEFDTPRWHTDDLFFSPQAATKQKPKKAKATASINHRRLGSLQSPFTSKFKFKSTGTTPIHYTSRQQKQNQTSTSPDNTSITQPTPQPTGAQIFTSNPNPPDWKLSTTLLGPGTLFITETSNDQARNLQRSTKTAVRNENPGHVCLSIRCVGCASAAETVRARLAIELEQHKIVQAQRGECVFFRVGENEGAVHSEPISHGDRIFVNVVPGDESDLKCLMAKWGMEFPRAWCVGLPLQMEGEEVYRNVGEV